MRARMVTRTVVGTKATVMVANTETQAIENVEVVVSNTYENDDKLLKAVKKAKETATFKCIAIVSSEKVETLYGMDEQFFIEHATVLDKETRKAIEAVEADNE